MSIRLLAWGALCAASCLLGTACGEAQAEEEKTGAFCGGIAGLPCPEGYACVDDPADTCDPAQGGADCGGICMEEGEDAGTPSQCPGDSPSRRYVSQDPEKCAAIRFFCDPGYQPFFNDCGCGCEPAP